MKGETMDIKEIAAVLGRRAKGAIFTVYADCPANGIAAAYKGKNIRKRSVYQAMLADYANRAPVKTAVADGDRAPVELPSHIKESFHVGHVKFWLRKDGKIQMPCVMVKSLKAEWILDGKVVDQSVIAPFMQPSALAPKPTKAETEEKGQALFCAPYVDNITDVK
jgi:hypothetical protein